MSLLKKVSANTIYQFVSRFITALASFFVARLIIESDTSLWGEYQTLITFVTVFWLLTDFGLNAVLVKEMSAHPEKRKQYFGALLTLRTSLGLILFGISFATLFFMPYGESLKLAIVIGLITLITQGIKGATHGLFQAQLTYKYQLYSDVWGTLFFVSALWWLLPTITVVKISILFAVSQIIMMLVSLLNAKRIESIEPVFDVGVLKPLAIATIPLGISLLFNLGNFKLDALLLSVMKGTGDVGIYNAGYKFFEFVLIIPTFFMNVMFPLLVSSYASSYTLFIKRFKSSFIVLVLGSIIGSIIGIIMAPFLIGLLGGANAEIIKDSVVILRILLITTPLFFVSSLFMWAVLVFGGQKHLIKVYATAFSVNLVLNLIVIPIYGYFGAAVTTGISECVIVILLGLKLFSYVKHHANHEQ